MTDHLFYLDTGNGIPRKLFIHANIANNFNGNAFLFFNPILDEKKRVQRFQAETSRHLCTLGYHVFRFDYYGTGDSQGELFQFNLDEILFDISKLSTYIYETYKIQELKLIGIRIGADLAAFFSSTTELIKEIHLIEPIFNGRKFLRMQRLRRKSFFSLRKMKDIIVYININNNDFEDFQGYPLSKAVIEFIEKIDLVELGLKNKNVFLYKLDSVYSESFLPYFERNIQLHNKLEITNIPLEEFWASFEFIDTSLLTNSIIKILK